MFDIEASDLTNSTTGSDFAARAIIDTNGLGKDLGLELVVYKKEDGEEKFWFTKPFDVIKEEGNVLTLHSNHCATNLMGSLMNQPNIDFFPN